jgi:hypothetical protein
MFLKTYNEIETKTIATPNARLDGVRGLGTSFMQRSRIQRQLIFTGLVYD